MRLPRVTYANVTSTLALFLSLGGVSWAAATLPRNSVGSAQIKAGAVTPAKLSSAAIRKLAGAPGPEGQAGPQGDRGPAGSSATVDAQLQSTIDAQKTQIQTLNATVTDLRAEIEDLTPRVTGAETAASAAGTTATTVSGQVTTLTGKVSTSCSKINSEVTRLNALNDGVGELVAGLNLVPGGFLPTRPSNASTISC
ncbi:MAG: hypothetical protein V9E83_07465 [Baekduia sp.]